MHPFVTFQAGAEPGNHVPAWNIYPYRRRFVALY
jgi:hypothetical protein